MEVNGQLHIHTQRKYLWYSPVRRLSIPKAVLNIAEKRKIPYPCWELNLDSSAIHP
jgi:hypothetical protein